MHFNEESLHLQEISLELCEVPGKLTSYKMRPHSVLKAKER